jgi:hypothetical protein
MGSARRATYIYPFEHEGELRSKLLSTTTVHFDAPGKVPFSGKWRRTYRIWKRSCV